MNFQADYTRICASCEREFGPSSRHRNCPKCRAEKRKTPCVKCGKPSHQHYKKCINCHNGSGSESPGWKGGMVYHKKGYVMLTTPERGYVFEHVLVMEAFLGRQLLEGEKVHHLNGIKDDNRLENLELWVRPHPAGIRASDAVAWAQEVLGLYAPELLNGCNTVTFEDGQDAPSMAPGPPVRH